MKASEVEKKLMAEGCHEDNICVGSCDAKSDVYCLTHADGLWRVYYRERGINSEPIYTSTSEEAACKFYFDHILSFDHWHLVGFFKDATNAKKLENVLKGMGITSIRNDIPAFAEANDPRFRLFVVGKQIFEVSRKFKNLPIKGA